MTKLCFILGDQLNETVALGGCIFGVRTDVEIQPSAIAKEHVGTATPRNDAPEEVPGHLVWTEPAVAVERARHTEFGLDAHDSPLHVFELTGYEVPAY